MFMDPRFTGFAEQEDQSLVSTFLQSLDTPQNDSLAALGFSDNPWTTLGPNHGHFVPPADLDSPDADDPMSKGPPADLDSPDDDDDPVSKYLSQILLEENIGEKPSIFRFKDMLDESVGMENNPRDAVLRLIRKLNPSLFVHTIVNGSVNSPFFDIRFREVLFHYNAHFDILEKTLPRDDPQRAVFEQEFFGREVFNVVACDGEERVSRPETYKKWGARSAGAGFRILPLIPEVMGLLRKKVKTGYHKEFVFDEDCDWALLGWKGRILCSCFLLGPCS